MKKTFLLLGIAAMLTSCQPGKVTNDTNGSGSCACDTGTNSLDSVMIPYEQGLAMVQRYRRSINWHDGDSAVLSYMVDAKALREYLNRDTDIVSLDLYLAIDSTSDSQKLAIVYIGAKADEANGMLHEEKYMRTWGSIIEPVVFNHGVPCPKCEKEGIFSVAGSGEAYKK